MRVVRVLPLLLLPTLAGCGTIVGLAGGLGYDSKVFVGTRLDVGVIGGGGWGPCGTGPLIPFAVLDFPLSLALDTGLLPFTLIYELFRPGPPHPGEREAPPPPAQWTKEDSWYRAPLQDPRTAHASWMDPSRIHDVSSSREKEAEELLRETSARELTEEEARRFSGKPIDPISGTRLYLVRGVVLNSGEFVVYSKDRTLWVEHRSKGKTPVPMKRRALVIQTSEIPSNVYCSCRMTE